MPARASGRSRRLTAAAAAVALMAAVAVLVKGVRYLDQLELTHAGEGLAVVAESVADEFAMLLHERVKDVVMVAKDLAHEDVPARAIDELRFVKEGSAFFLSLAMTDVEGQIVAATDPSSIGRDQRQSEWFAKARDGDGPQVLDLRPSEDAGGAWALTIATATHDDAGTFQGAIVALVGVAPVEATIARRVSDLDAQLPKPASVEWLLLRQDGVVIADSSGRRRGDDVRAAGLRSAYLSDALENGHVVEDDVRTAASMVTGYAHLSGATNAEELHWRVLLRRTQSEVLGPLHRSLGLVGLAFAVVLVPALGALLMASGARRRAEAEKTLAHARLQAIVEQARDAIVVMDLDGRIQDFNGAAERMFGWPRGEAIGQELAEVIVSPKHRAQREGVARGSMRDQTGELAAVRRTGEEFPIELSIAKATTADTTFFSAIIRDVTERRRLELDLRHSQKLESVGQLAAGVAHEINTPIQFVGDNVLFLDESFKNVLALLKQYGEAFATLCAGGADRAIVEEVERAADEADVAYLEKEIPKAISQTLDGVHRVATIVRAMKDFAHADNKERQPADLNQAILSTLTVARNELKYVADVDTEFGELPTVVCRVSDLNQVFLNLFVNAAHAIGDVVGNTGAKGRIVVRTSVDGDHVVIAVSDTGGGIPEEIRERIFDPFFTTKEVGRGSGQGLSIARRIVVEVHGGRLTFETEVGRGTTFYVHLPIAPAASSAAA